MDDFIQILKLLALINKWVEQLWWWIHRGRKLEALIKQLGSNSSQWERERAKAKLIKLITKNSPDEASYIDALIEAACSREDGNLRENAADVLKKIGPSAIRPMIVYRASSNRENLDTNAIDGILSQGKENVDELLKLLKDPDWKVQRDTADFLGQIGDTRAIEPLAKLASDSSAIEVRIQCISSLGKFKGPDVATRLLPFLKDSNPSKLREAAAEALGEVGEPEATDELLDQFKREKDPALLRATAAALGALQARDALPVLEEALFRDETDRQVKMACIEAISKINGSDGKEILNKGNEFFHQKKDNELQHECLKGWLELDSKGA